MFFHVAVSQHWPCTLSPKPFGCAHKRTPPAEAGAIEPQGGYRQQKAEWCTSVKNEMQS